MENVFIQLSDDASQFEKLTLMTDFVVHGHKSF